MSFLGDVLCKWGSPFPWPKRNPRLNQPHSLIFTAAIVQVLEWTKNKCTSVRVCPCVSVMSADSYRGAEENQSCLSLDWESNLSRVQICTNLQQKWAWAGGKNQEQFPITCRNKFPAVERVKVLKGSLGMEDKNKILPEIMQKQSLQLSFDWQKISQWIFSTFKEW